MYIVVYHKIEITNNTIGVSFAKAIIVEKRGRFKINWALFAAQVSNMGGRRHKGKGGHVDRKGKKNFDCHLFTRRMFTPSLINLDSLITDEKEVTTKVYLNEKNNPHILKRVNLVQLLDVKEKKIATI